MLHPQPLSPCLPPRAGPHRIMAAIATAPACTLLLLSLLLYTALLLGDLFLICPPRSFGFFFTLAFRIPCAALLGFFGDFGLIFAGLRLGLVAIFVFAGFLPWG